MSGCSNFMVIAITFYVLSDHKRTNLDIKNRNGVKYKNLYTVLNENWVEREIKNET